MARFSSSDWSCCSATGELGLELDWFEAEEEVSEEDSELALEMLIILTAGLDMVLEMTGAGGNGNIVVVVVTAGDTERTGVVVVIWSSTVLITEGKLVLKGFVWINSLTSLFFASPLVWDLKRGIFLVMEK